MYMTSCTGPSIEPCGTLSVEKAHFHVEHFDGNLLNKFQTKPGFSLACNNDVVFCLLYVVAQVIFCTSIPSKPDS